MKIAIALLYLCFSAAVLYTASYLDTFQLMIIKSIEIAYTCKDRGLVLRQCEHEVKVELQK